MRTFPGYQKFSPSHHCSVHQPNSQNTPWRNSFSSSFWTDLEQVEKFNDCVLLNVIKMSYFQDDRSRLIYSRICWNDHIVGECNRWTEVRVGQYQWDEEIKNNTNWQGRQYNDWTMIPWLLLVISPYLGAFAEKELLRGLDEDQKYCQHKSDVHLVWV